MNLLCERKDRVVDTFKKEIVAGNTSENDPEVANINPDQDGNDDPEEQSEGVFGILLGKVTDAWIFVFNWTIPNCSTEEEKEELAEMDERFRALKDDRERAQLKEEMS